MIFDGYLIYFKYIFVTRRDEMNALDDTKILY